MQLFRNFLYIYPLSLNFNNRTGSCRNIKLTIQVLETEAKSGVLEVNSGVLEVWVWVLEICLYLDFILIFFIFPIFTFSAFMEGLLEEKW